MARTAQSVLSPSHVASPLSGVDPTGESGGTYKNVWSRSGSKYRVRAIVLLALDVMLFAGVGCFSFWLRNGVVFAPATESYRDALLESFRFGSESRVSLGSLLVQPISVQHVEMQIWVLGLLMAALISIPILISILYHFWSSIPFIAVVGFLAVMPWLAITLLGSCLIASVRPFRSRFRFTSALFALVPAVIYLYLAWGGTADVLAGTVDPVDRIKFIAPWVLAIVAAALVFAVVLVIAKLVDYRPGAITPLLAIMFGLPVGLFEFHVGRDELYYRLLESLDQEYFTDIDASVPFRQAVEQAWERHPPPRPSWEAVRARKATEWLFGLASEIDPFHTLLAKNQAMLVKRCDWFRRHYPDSRYALDALFIKARGLDMRVDAGAFRRTNWIRFYDDFPSRASRSTWRIIAENHAEPDVLAVALLRLAQLEAREGDADHAIAKLDRLLQEGRLESHGINTDLLSKGSSSDRILSPTDVDLRIHLDRVLLEAHRLRDLLKANRDPLYGYDPMSGSPPARAGLWFGLLDLEPTSENYSENLRRIKKSYPHCQLEDNIDLEIAKATPVLSLKIDRLVRCLRDFPRRDMAAEALFRLARAYSEAGRLNESRMTFSRLYRDHAGSIWAAQAIRYASSPAADEANAGGAS